MALPWSPFARRGRTWFLFSLVPIVEGDITMGLRAALAIGAPIVLPPEPGARPREARRAIHWSWSIMKTAGRVLSQEEKS